MTIKDRPKASELLKKGKIGFLVSGEPRSFEEQFPTIENIAVKSTQTGQGTYGDDVSYMTKENLGDFLDCHNPLCYGGGFLISKVISEMVKENKTEYTRRGSCRGWESSPGGLKRRKKCINRFDVEVRIKYRPTAFGP